MRDYGCLPPTQEIFSSAEPLALKGLKILLVMEGDTGEPPEPGVESCVRNAAKALQDAGAIVEEKPDVIGKDFLEVAGIPLMLRGLAEFLKLDEDQRARAPENFRKSFGRAEALSAGKIALALDEIEARKARVLGQMAGYDFLISPISGMSAFPAEATQPTSKSSNPMYTPVWNQTGNPALSICCGFDPDNNMPVGLQMVGHRFDDFRLLQLAMAYETVRDVKMNWPSPAS